MHGFSRPYFFFTYGGVGSGSVEQSERVEFSILFVGLLVCLSVCLSVFLCGFQGGKRGETRSRSFTSRDVPLSRRMKLYTTSCHAPNVCAVSSVRDAARNVVIIH